MNDETREKTECSPTGKIYAKVSDMCRDYGLPETITKSVEEVEAEQSTGYERAQAALEASRTRISERPAIRIGSRWRNKAHGFVFRLLSFESIDAGTWVKLYERNASDGFAWAGLESQLLQQWEQIDP